MTVKYTQQSAGKMWLQTKCIPTRSRGRLKAYKIKNFSGEPIAISTLFALFIHHFHNKICQIETTHWTFKFEQIICKLPFNHQLSMHIYIHKPNNGKGAKRNMLLLFVFYKKSLGETPSLFSNINAIFHHLNSIFLMSLWLSLLLFYVQLAVVHSWKDERLLQWVCDTTSISAPCIK